MLSSICQVRQALSRADDPCRCCCPSKGCCYKLFGSNRDQLGRGSKCPCGWRCSNVCGMVCCIGCCGLCIVGGPPIWCCYQTKKILKGMKCQKYEIKEQMSETVALFDIEADRDVATRILVTRAQWWICKMTKCVLLLTILALWKHQALSPRYMKLILTATDCPCDVLYEAVFRSF